MWGTLMSLSGTASGFIPRTPEVAALVNEKSAAVKLYCTKKNERMYKLCRDLRVLEFNFHPSLTFLPSDFGVFLEQQNHSLPRASPRLGGRSVQL